MRIAIFCPSYGQVGGIEAKAERLAAAFRAAGHEVLVLARGAPAASAADVVRVAFHQLPRRARHVARQLRFALAFPGVTRRLRAAVRDWRAEAVLSLTVPSYAPYAMALAREAPLIVSLEGGGPGVAANPRVLRAALRAAGRVVACATTLARTALALAPELGARLSVIPNGVDPEAFAGARPYAHPRPYVLAVARLSREKGIDVLLEAFVCGVPADVDLLIAGDGPERAALEVQRATLGLGGRVHFLGTVEPAGVAALYGGALVVACPSRWEGLPLVALEAMASARPVVAAAVDGVPDAVTPASGVLVPPEDPAALARALTALLADPARRAALGAAGARIVGERFTWSTVAARYLEVVTAAARER